MNKTVWIIAATLLPASAIAAQSSGFPVPGFGPAASPVLLAQVTDGESVIKPPPSGDSEMVIPAPDIGTIEVIPPESLPQQDQGLPDAPAEDGEPGFKTGDIIDAIANSSAVARLVQDWSENTPIEVVNISIMFEGADAAAINASLSEHAGGVGELHAALTANQSLSRALEAKGARNVAIVAVEVDENGVATFFVR